MFSTVLSQKSNRSLSSSSEVPCAVHPGVTDRIQVPPWLQAEHRPGTWGSLDVNTETVLPVRPLWRHWGKPRNAVREAGAGCPGSFTGVSLHKSLDFARCLNMQNPVMYITSFSLWEMKRLIQSRSSSVGQGETHDLGCRLSH